MWFIGGCRGNKNNFLTIYECHSECRKNVLSSLSALKGVVDALQIQQPQKGQILVIAFFLN